MPHPRINKNLKGDYVRVASFAGVDKGKKSKDMAGWVAVSNIKKAVRVVDGQGDSLQITLKSQGPPLVLRGPNLNDAEAKLRKKNIPSA